MAERPIWRERVRDLKTDAYALLLACRDRRAPWYARALAAGVVAYALSPIDLIPDFIPVLGLLDDLVLVPLGIALVRRMIPAAVLEECRTQAQEEFVGARPRSWAGAVPIIAIWALLAGWVIAFFFR